MLMAFVAFSAWLLKVVAFKEGYSFFSQRPSFLQHHPFCFLHAPKALPFLGGLALQIARSAVRNILRFIFSVKGNSSSLAFPKKKHTCLASVLSGDGEQWNSRQVRRFDRSRFHKCYASLVDFWKYKKMPNSPP